MALRCNGARLAAKGALPKASPTPAHHSVASTPSGREIVDFTPVLAVLNNILAELHNSSGDIVIGDDVIYRSFNRARQSQSIMLGGAY